MSDTGTLCFRMPLVPVMVKVEVPLGVVPRVVICRVEEPEPVTVDGLKVPVTLLGKPLTPKVTCPLNPPEGVTVTA